MEKNKLITGQCPHCKTQLSITEGESVSCPNCDVIVTSDEIAKKDARDYGNVFANEQGVASNNVSQYAVYIENPASGLAYLENRFETNDWEEYESNLIFELDDIETVVEKNKVTNANNPDTWLLEFKSIVVPITHKIEGVSKIIDNIVEKYNPLDLTNTFELFDDYLKIANALVNKKESIMRVLDADIKFMEKFNLPATSLSTVKKEYEKFKGIYEDIVVVNKLEELPAVGKAIAKIQKNIADNLSKEGIDAEELYQEAVADYNDPLKSENALAKFQSLKGYKDSSKYIKKINSISNFNGVIEANGELLYSITGREIHTFDVKAPAEPPKPAGAGCGKAGKGNNSSKVNSANVEPISTEPTYTGNMTSLFKIVHKDYDADKPIVSKISAFLTSYNGKLFYISEDKEINALNLNNNEVIKLDSGKLGSYDKKFIWGSDRKSIYIKKRLESKPAIMTKKGCSGKGINAPKIQLNNFSLLKIDLITATATCVVDELIDIMDVFGNYVFFTQSREVSKIVKGNKGKDITVKENKSFFTSYNLKDGEVVDMLEENVCIIGATDGKVVYSKFSPVTYNMDLYVYDVESKESVLLENNIYEATRIHNGKVLYTVGSFYRRSLFSIKLDGTERTEILLNVEKIQWFDKNWMYVVKGYSYNATLIKISYDGKNRVVIATGISKLIKMTSGYVYYIDYNDNLCMVRTDGKRKEIITRDCENAQVIISSDCIFLMNKERMDARGNVVSKSLYSMDLQGHNLKKVYYDLIDMQEIDEQRIFFLQQEKRKYKITTPQEKGEPIVTYINPTITNYYSYDKFTHEIDKILVLGEPKEQTFEFKPGCFLKKKVLEHSIIEEVTEEKGYERVGKMTPGQVASEEAEKEKEEAEKAKENSLNPLSSMKSVEGRGTNVSNSSGCLGCFGSSKTKK